MDIPCAVYPERRLGPVFVQQAAFRVHYEISLIGRKRDSICLQPILVTKVSQSDVVGHGKVAFRNLAQRIGWVQRHR